MDVLLVVDRRRETMGASCATMIPTKYFNVSPSLSKSTNITVFPDSERAIIQGTQSVYHMSGQVLHFGLLLIMMATPFLLKDFCP